MSQKINRSELERIQANEGSLLLSEEEAQRESKSMFGDQAKRSFHSVSSWSVKILGWVGIFIVATTFLIRSWHLLAPECWQWLKEKNIEKIDHIIIAILAGLVARFFPSEKD